MSKWEMTTVELNEPGAIYNILIAVSVLFFTNWAQLPDVSFICVNLPKLGSASSF